MKKIYAFTILCCLSFSNILAQVPSPDRNAAFKSIQNILDTHENPDVYSYNAFGGHIKIAGNTLVIAAHQDRSDQDMMGTVYVYERNDVNSPWELVKNLKPSINHGANFSEYTGNGIDISRDGKIIAFRSGYGFFIYEKNNDGTWNETETHYINTGGGGFQGAGTLAISDDLKFGSSNLDGVRIAFTYASLNNTPGTATVVIYRKNNTGNWYDDDRIVKNGGQTANDYFGTFLTWTGDELIIGAQGENNNTGAIYIYKYQQNNTSVSLNFKRRIKTSNGNQNDYFPSYIIADDKRIVAGKHSGGTNGNRGEVYVFEKDSNGNYTETESISLIPKETTINFGRGLAFSDSGLVVGAFSNEVYNYKIEFVSGGIDKYTLQEIITPDLSLSPFDIFGNTVATSEDKILIYSRHSGTFDGFVQVLEKVDPTDHPDYAALKALYDATGGANWTNKWDLEKTSIQNLYGITVANNRVTRLDLASNNLKGKIPHEIGALSKLNILYMDNNFLTGEIPSEMGDLTELEWLHLGQNELEGAIPSELGDIASLVSLGLSNNNLSGKIPSEIFNLKKLYQLVLVKNHLEGEIPNNIGNLESIVHLKLDNNNLSGDIPSGISNCKTLYHLLLHGNKLEGKLPDLTGLKNLSSLSVYNNHFLVDDLIENYSAYKTLVNTPWTNSGYYSPQNHPESVIDSITYGVGIEIELKLKNGSGSNKVIAVKIAKVEDTYQWFKDFNLINGATSDNYIITNSQEPDSGVYFCEVYNSEMPELIVRGNPITIKVSSALSVDENEILKNAITIYPNPAHDFIMIKQNDNIIFKELSIYNVLGRKVKNTQNKTDRINIGNLTNGIYFIKIKTDKGETSRKLIVSK